MKIINLFDTNADVEMKRFSGGECHIKFKESYTENDKIQLNIRLNSSDDVMFLCLAVDALRNMGVKQIEAFFPYLPYARQDRVMVPGEPLSVKVFANLINSLKLDRVTVFDAHSDVSVALLDNCRNIPNYNMVAYFLESLNLIDYTLVSPDLGAYKKVDKLAEKLKYKGQIATGIKVRDLASGKITKSDINTDDLEGKACVVVDDICDGGRTFIELATALKAKNAGDLYFIASHGIFSYNALDRLKEAGYKSVGSSNSVSNIPEDGFYNRYNVFKREISEM